MKQKAIILGAGITGLSAAWKLSENGYQVKIIEKEKFTGGMSATFKHKDYYLDFGPHKIFTVLDNIKAELDELYKDEKLLEIQKSSKVRLNGKYIKFPFGIADIIFGLGVLTGFKCGIGYFFALLKNIFIKKESQSYQEWVVNRFGKATYDLVLGPYAWKVWGNPDELSAELAETRIAAPNLMEMIKQIILGQKKDSPVINAEVFQYPQKGFGDIGDKILNRIKKNRGKVQVGLSAKKIELDKDNNIKKIIYNDDTFDVISDNDVVISTIPLAVLVNLLPQGFKKRLSVSCDGLKNRRLILLYIVFQTERIITDNWLFFPEAKYSFNRIFEQKAFNENMVPDDKTVICIEITCDQNDPLWNSSDQEVYKHVEAQLKEADLLDNPVIEVFTKRIENGYPIYDKSYKKNLFTAMNDLNIINNLYSVGRQGGFSYTGMADSMDIGISTAGFVINKFIKQKEWIPYTEKFYNYVVVD